MILDSMVPLIPLRLLTPPFSHCTQVQGLFVMMISTTFASSPTLSFVAFPGWQDVSYNVPQAGMHVA